MSVQVAVPAEQSSVPVWQGLVGTQGDPELHALHSPLLHTIPVPQALPLLALLLSMHAACPVLHEVCPTRQGAPVTSQVAPALQVRHVPWWQTLSVPHFAPSSRGAPRSVHTGTPPVHESVPWWQALVGTQPAPALQATHWPTEHTWPDPHGVPSAALPDSTHADTPVAQLVRPSLHAWPRSHTRPSTHAEHTPSGHAGSRAPCPPSAPGKQPPASHPPSRERVRPLPRPHAIPSRDTATHSGANARMGDLQNREGGQGM